MPASETAPLPTLAVWKFASCDGCQLTLLNCEDELLALAGKIQIAYFPEATRAVVSGPYDLSLVEGSITTAEDATRIREVRRMSRPGWLEAVGTRSYGWSARWSQPGATASSSAPTRPWAAVWCSIPCLPVASMPTGSDGSSAAKSGRRCTPRFAWGR